MTSLAHNWQTDADRAADAIVSLRNDEVMRHLSRHFHEQFNGANAQADALLNSGIGSEGRLPQCRPLCATRLAMPEISTGRPALPALPSGTRSPRVDEPLSAGAGTKHQRAGVAGGDSQ